MDTSSNINTSYIDNSSCFRYINNDDDTYARIIITALSYNTKELCRVFSDKLDEKEIDDLNKYKRCSIDFKSSKITDKQLEHIRESKNGLQNALINLLYEKYNIKKTGKYSDRFNDFSTKLKIKITLYDINKNILFKTTGEGYEVNVLKNNEQYYVISNIDRFKPLSNYIQAGEKKKKNPTDDIPITSRHIDMINEPDVEKALIENEKRFLSTPFSIQSVLSFVANDSPSIRAQLKNKDINININYDKIDEFVFLLTCNNCIWCMKIDVNNSMDFIKRYHTYTLSHKHIIRGKPFYYNKCKKCKNLHFDSNNHKCNFNQKCVMVKSNDECYSLYYNELITQ